MGRAYRTFGTERTRYWQMLKHGRPFVGQQKMCCLPQSVGGCTTVYSRLEDFRMGSCRRLVGELWIAAGLKGERRDFLRLWDRHKSLYQISTEDEGESAVTVLSEIMDAVETEEAADVCPKTPNVDTSPFEVWRSILEYGYGEVWQDCHAGVILELQGGVDEMDQASTAADFEQEGGGDRAQHNEDSAVAYDSDKAGVDGLDSIEWDADGLNTEGSDADENETTEGKATITTTLAAILHPDLIDHVHTIVHLIDEAQWSVTDVFDEMSVLLLEALMISVKGILRTTRIEPTFDIRHLLPPSFTFRDKSVNPIVAVAPIDDRVWNMLGDNNQQEQKMAKDAKDIFGQSFVAYLYARFVGPSQQRLASQTDTDHPFWDHIVSQIRHYRNKPTSQGIWTPEGDVDAQYALPHPVQRGLSQTLNTYFRDLAQDFSNIWNGNTFHKLLNYTIRTTLRLNLTPNKEQASRDIQQKKSREKAATTSTSTTTSPSTATIASETNKQWELSFKTKKLMTQLDRLICKDDDINTRHRIAAICTQLTRLHQLKAKGLSSTTSTTSTTSPTEFAKLFEADDHSELVCVAGLLVPTTMAEIVAQDLGYRDYDCGNDVDDGGSGDECPSDNQVAVTDEKSKNLENPDHTSVKEPSAARLTALQTVTRNLLLSSRIERENVDVDWVRRSSFSKDDFTIQECEVVSNIVRLLRPFIPRQKVQGQDRLDCHHPLLLAPFCVLANTILRATGYSHFTRCLSPIPSVSKLHALHLSATGLYETLCGFQVGRFRVYGPDGPITNASQVTKSMAHKEAMFDSFFDMRTINELCASHGCAFARRISYVDHLTVRILGDKIQPPHHNAVTSSLDAKRKSHIQPGRVKWSSESSLVRELGLDAEVEAQAVAEELKEANAQLRKTNKDIVHTTACITGLKKAGGGSNSAEVSEQNKSREGIQHFMQGDTAISTNVGGSHRRLPSSYGTGGLLDGVDYLHRVVASGTDYGLSTMSVTVAILLDQVNNMLARYQSQGTSTNQVNCKDSDNTESQSNILTRDELAHQLKLPRPHVITAESIRHISGSSTCQRLRQKRLQSSAHADVRRALEALSRNTLHRLIHLEDIERSQASRRSQRKVLRSFEQTPELIHARRTYHLQKDRTVKTLLARERDYIKRHALAQPSLDVSTYDGWCTIHHRHHLPKNGTGSFSFLTVGCPLVQPNVAAIMSIGDAGMSVGSRIGGHYKAAGHYLRKEHRRYSSILWAPEFRTSKLCVLCFKQVSLVKTRREIGGKWRTVRVNGATVCSNPECRGHECGYTIRGRDTQAAANICLVGMSIALSDTPKSVLQPFVRFSRPDKVTSLLENSLRQ